MSLDRCEKLLALAIDSSTTEAERRTAAMVLCEQLHKDALFERIRKIVAGFEVLNNWFRANRKALNKLGAQVPIDF